MVYNVKADTVNTASAWFNYAFLAFLLSNFSLAPFFYTWLYDEVVQYLVFIILVHAYDQIWHIWETLAD